MERESFKSRLGFILVSAGCAIGIGNVWKFPFVTGQNGGGIFVLFYLLFLLIMGIPVLTMEFAVGRASKKSTVLGFKTLEPAGTKWHLFGWVCLFGCILLMMYYTTVAGWMLLYFIKFLFGDFSRIDIGAVDGVFGDMLGNPMEMGLAMAMVVVVGFLICSLGVQKGLERVTKFMMVALLALILILVIHSFLLPNAAEGLKFYLLPDMEKAKEQGLGNVITAAMNQAFFTLSLGVGAMEIFATFIKNDRTLTQESIWICVLDTIVAIFSGLIIFPACFSFGVEPNAGPALIFLTLPRVFKSMPLGNLWGTLFFLFMFFASFSTVLAVFENILSNFMDNFNWDRKKSVLIALVIILIGSIPCVLGYNMLSNFHPMPGKDILDTEDFIVSNLILPIGSLVFLLFCTSKYGWGFDNYLEECNAGSGVKMYKGFSFYFKFILPLLIIFILVQGLR